MDNTHDQTNDVPWFPKYIKVSPDGKASSNGLNGNVYVLEGVTQDYHSAYYWSYVIKDFILLHYDGYEYSYLFGNNVECIPSNAFEFLKVSKRFSGDSKSLTYIKNAWDDIIEKFGSIGCQNLYIDGTGASWHIETYYDDKWYNWNDIQTLNYFPDYINLSNNEHDHIYVLDHIIDDKSAYYWRCSGEYGIRINYNNYTYAKRDEFSSLYNPVNLKPATACQFILDNSMYKLGKTKKYYDKAIKEIKDENPFFVSASFEHSHGYSYVKCTFKNIYENWTL